MQANRCNRCGAITDDCDLETGREYVGECFGTPAYENVSICPHCGSSNIEEIELCSECNEVIEDESYNGLCKSCVLDRVSLTNAIKLGSYITTKVSINSFFEYCLSEEEINQILKRHIQNNIDFFMPQIKSYCEEDLDALADLDI